MYSLVPLVGMFGGKEIAPNDLGDETLVHEYTSVFGIVQEGTMDS
jgi:small ligand-binding sensory domain FIST